MVSLPSKCIYEGAPLSTVSPPSDFVYEGAPRSNVSPPPAVPMKGRHLLWCHRPLTVLRLSMKGHHLEWCHRPLTLSMRGRHLQWCHRPLNASTQGHHLEWCPRKPQPIDGATATSRTLPSGSRAPVPTPPRPGAPRAKRPRMPCIRSTDGRASPRPLPRCQVPVLRGEVTSRVLRFPRVAPQTTSTPRIWATQRPGQTHTHKGLSGMFPVLAHAYCARDRSKPETMRGGHASQTRVSV